MQSEKMNYWKRNLVKDIFVLILLLAIVWLPPFVLISYINNPEIVITASDRTFAWVMFGISVFGGLCAVISQGIKTYRSFKIVWGK